MGGQFPKMIVFEGNPAYQKIMPNIDLPIFVSIPHSGEKVPNEVTWLNKPEVTLMRDVDRFVDILYKPAIENLNLPLIQTQWHRYVVDLNRTTQDFDETAVVGAPHPKGSHPKGLHWCVTTQQEPLIEEPMTMELHNSLVENYYKPFHDSVTEMGRKLQDKYGSVFHLDLHSMPSRGTSLHPDPGETRAEVVVSDFHGKSAIPEFKNLVMKSVQEAGFQVAYNWPYVGGGITQLYGRPNSGHNTIQIELNRALYMNEKTKKLNDTQLPEIQKKLERMLSLIVDGLKDLLNG